MIRLTKADFDARIAAAREIVKRNKLDAIMVFSTECEPAQVRYFADYWPSSSTRSTTRRQTRTRYSTGTRRGSSA